MKKQMTVDDLREAVDSAKVVEIIQSFDGQPNLVALTTLACAIGLVIGAEFESPGQLVASLTAASFIINDSAQLAIKESSPLIKTKKKPQPEPKPTLN